jgi:hypothetical protein
MVGGMHFYKFEGSALDIFPILKDGKMLGDL